jgi:hypothetical protein
MTADANVEEHDDFCDCCLDALNERADRILALLLDGNLDEAEAMAHDLMRDFPDEVEGIDLLSMVSEARGERERTVGLLRRAIEIVRVHPFHDAETRLLMHQRLRQLEQAGLTTPLGILPPGSGSPGTADLGESGTPRDRRQHLTPFRG